MTKKEQIQDLDNKINLYFKKINKINGLPKPKRKSTYLKRAFRVVSYCLEIRWLITQKMIISSQPIPKSKKGCAIVGESKEPELIINSNQKITSIAKLNL